MMITLNVHLISAVNILIKRCTGENNSQQLVLYMCSLSQRMLVHVTRSRLTAHRSEAPQRQVRCQTHRTV